METRSDADERSGPASRAGGGWPRVRSRLAGLPIAPTTIGGRLALTYALIVALVMGLFGFAIVQAVSSAAIERASRTVEGEARFLAESVAPLLAGGDSEAVEALAGQAGASLGARVRVVDGAGRVVADSGVAAESGGAAGPSEPGPAATAGEPVRVWTDPRARERFLIAEAPLPGSTGGVVQVARPLADLDAVGDWVVRAAVAATLLTVLLMASLGDWIARRITGPLADLRRQARAVAQGRFDVSVVPAATRELGDLGVAFNAMTRQLRRSREDVEGARARLQATLANLSDGVVVTDERGTVVSVNAAAARMLDLPSGWLERPFVEAIRDHELAALLHEALERPDGASVAGAVEFGREGRALEAVAQRVRAPDEDLGLMVLRDVTELRRLEGVRRDFVANVSHELRTPLASIRALVETLEAGAAEDPAVADDFFRRIVNEVDRLTALVDDLLDLARLESGRMALRREAVAPRELLEAGARRLRAQVDRARLRLEVDGAEADDLPPVAADRVRVEQVLLNLVHNAIRFTPPGGRIRVSARRHGDGVAFVVADDGVGIPPDELPRLFERFYKADKSRSTEGTGLGLAIAKHIVLAHGGTIWAESEPGQGATFTFTLPLAGARGEAAAEGEAEPARPERQGVARAG